MPAPASPLHRFLRLALSVCVCVGLGGVAAPAGAEGGVAADVAAMLAPRPGVEGPLLAEVAAEPVIRVRVRAGVGAVTLGRAGGRVAVRGGGPAGAGSLLPGPVAVAAEASAGGFTTTDAAGSRLRWRVATLHAAAEAAADPVVLDGTPHPGTLVLALDAGRPGTMDAVEHVGLEAYLPGVLDRELYASWEPEAFRRRPSPPGATRSGRCGWPGSPTATTAETEATDAASTWRTPPRARPTAASRENPKAPAAVAATRGVVLAWNGRVLPAFYSSAVGGPGGDGPSTFPGRAPDLAPLRGRDHGRIDAASPRAAWGPVTRDRATLTRRIAAWGSAKKHPVAALRSLDRIEPAAVNAAGRMAAWRLIDASGRSFLLRADELRHAANAAASGLPAATGDDRLYSGDFRVRRAGGAFLFDRGRGFGHGVGLSQWGAQGMAASGAAHPAILAEYYPGATLVRAYR